jgi:hypothetical protein
MKPQEMIEPATATAASQMKTLPLTGLTTLAFLICFSGKNLLFITFDDLELI